MLLEGDYLPAQLDALQNELFDIMSKSSSQLEINLKGVVGGDSGLIAALLACMRQAKKEGKKVIFTGFSQQLVGLLQLSNLDGIVIVSR